MPHRSDVPLGSDTVKILRVRGDGVEVGADHVACEEPLAIELTYARRGSSVVKRLTVTMRTPGHDEELTAGFLLAEGVVRHPRDIESIDVVRTAMIEPIGAGHTARVTLAGHVRVELLPLERTFATTSSCGVCGKTSLAALQARVEPAAVSAAKPLFDVETLCRLPERLREAQPLFAQTGGLHAAGLFDVRGQLMASREDVGRHNAVDKVMGAAFLAGQMPLETRILLVSGRTSFELVQKAVVAGVPILAAVGAPSSLAVKLATHHELTLLGFVGPRRFNAYSGLHRVDLQSAALADTHP